MRAGGEHLVRISQVPDGVACLPVPHLLTYFGSIPGWGPVASVQRVECRGLLLSNELWVRTQLAADVPLKGTVMGLSADGRRVGPGTGVYCFQVWPTPLPVLPLLSALQQASATRQAPAAAAGAGGL
jgi:hypothetical protein